MTYVIWAIHGKIDIIIDFFKPMSISTRVCQGWILRLVVTSSTTT